MNDPEVPEVIEKIRERLDIEQWALEHMTKMSEVQAYGEWTIYEGMMNSFILSLSPYWPDGFEKKWDEIREIGMGPEHDAPDDPLHKQRLMKKELLKAELIDAIGIGFTKKRRAKVGDLARLWELYPPIPLNNEPISKS